MKRVLFLLTWTFLGVLICVEAKESFSLPRDCSALFETFDEMEASISSLDDGALAIRSILHELEFRSTVHLDLHTAYLDVLSAVEASSLACDTKLTLQSVLEVLVLRGDSHVEGVADFFQTKSKEKEKNNRDLKTEEEIPASLIIGGVELLIAT